MPSKLSKSIVRAGAARTAQAARRVGPVATLDMGKFAVLRGVSVADRKSHLNVLDKVKRFDQLRLHPAVRQCVEETALGAKPLPPTPVQKVAIKALRKPREPAFQPWLIAAETGSGKTLAYLAPVLSALLDARAPANTDRPSTAESAAQPESPERAQNTERTQEIAPEHGLEHGPKPGLKPSAERTHSGPAIRAMVLVPTVELAEQVLATAAQCAPPRALNMALFAGLGSPTGALARRVKRGVDLAVGTPDKLLRLCEEHPALMARALESCNALVVDEADSLMNRSFEPSTTALVARCAELQDLVFVSATIPHSFDKLLRERFPRIRHLVTPSIHRLPRHIEFRVVEVWHRPYHNKKMLALQQALYSIYHDNSESGKVKRVVVFVNKKKDVEPLVAELRAAGYAAAGLAPDRANLADFVDAQDRGDGADPLSVLVATDLVARGVDFHRVRNVVLYDMPPSAADLLHRAGRTGRLGTKGRVLLLVSKSESKGWIRGLETVVKRGMALA